MLPCRFSGGNKYLNKMRELEKRLKEVQKQGCEYITVTQVIQWMYEIKRDNRLKRHERKANAR